MLEDLIVANARTWIDTPWMHNQKAKGLGVDCVQFAIASLEPLGVETGEPFNYYRTPQGNSLLEYLDNLPSTRRVEQIEAGRLLVFEIAGVPHHVGIATGENAFIHACSRAGRVIEQTIGAWGRKVVAIYEVKRL
jgi:cell wall-associated NlpC family hydrolase